MAFRKTGFLFLGLLRSLRMNLYKSTLLWAPQLFSSQVFAALEKLNIKYCYYLKFFETIFRLHQSISPHISFCKPLLSSKNIFSYTNYCENNAVKLHKQDECVLCD